MPARIMIVEDMPYNMELMSYLLEVRGHEVVPAGDGRTALELSAASPPPDLVVMDLQLPDMSGEEVMAALRGRPGMAQVPYVAVTALAMVGDRDRLLAAGFDAYVSKPLDPVTFATELEGHLPAERRGSAPAVFGPVEAGQPRTPAGEGPLVLVVDDWPTNVELMRSILEPSGYRVVGAASVAEGLARARAERPALILSDIHLGRESGFTLFEAVRADPDLAGCTFAFLSSSAKSGGDDAHRAAGYAYFIARPIEPNDVLIEVGRLVQRGA